MAGRLLSTGIAQADDPIYNTGWIMGGVISYGKPTQKKQTKLEQSGSKEQEKEKSQEYK